MHIQDISHPDWVSQKNHVEETLASLNVPQNVLNKVINVYNKSDLLTQR